MHARATPRGTGTMKGETVVDDLEAIAYGDGSPGRIGKIEFIEQVVASDQQRRADTEARLEGVGHEPIIPAPLESFRVFRDR